MSKVAEAIVEQKKALADMALPHEGLRDYAKLNLKDDARTANAEAIAQYDRRKNLLDVAVAALEALVDDGYPVLEIPPVDVSAFEDLKINQASINAAFAKFGTAAAVNLNITTDPPVQK